MDDQTPSQNSKRKVEIDHKVIKPYLERLDDLLKKIALEIGDYSGVKGLNHLFAAFDFTAISSKGPLIGRW